MIWATNAAILPQPTRADSLWGGKSSTAVRAGTSAALRRAMSGTRHIVGRTGTAGLQQWRAPSSIGGL